MSNNLGKKLQKEKNLEMENLEKKKSRNLRIQKEKISRIKKGRIACCDCYHMKDLLRRDCIMNKIQKDTDTD